jgi:hypothetical protein
MNFSKFIFFQDGYIVRFRLVRVLKVSASLLSDGTEAVPMVMSAQENCEEDDITETRYGLAGCVKSMAIELPSCHMIRSHGNCKQLKPRTTGDCLIV